MGFIFHALQQRHHLNIYALGILGIVQSFYERFSIMWQKLEEKLKDAHFRCAWRDFIYVLESENEQNAPIVNFDGIKSIVRRHYYEEFMDIWLKEEERRTEFEQRDVECMERFHSFFLENLTLYDKKHCGFEEVKRETVFTPQAALFFSFVFISLPADPTKVASSDFEKVDAFFRSLETFVNFIYGACYKYYVGSKNVPKGIRKIIDNAISFERYQNTSENSGYTFMRAIYFSGRFDRTNGPEGIYLPLPGGKMLLKSRSNMHAHRQCRSFSELTMNTLPSVKAKRMIKFENHPLLKIYGDFEDISESDSFSTENEFSEDDEPLRNIKNESVKQSVQTSSCLSNDQTAACLNSTSTDANQRAASPSTVIVPKKRALNVSPARSELNVANTRDSAQQSDQQSAVDNSNSISLSTNDVVSDANLKSQAAPISIYNQSEPDEEIPGQTSVDQPDMTGEEIKRRLGIALPNSNQEFTIEWNI